MFTRGYVSSGSRKTLQNQVANQWDSFCHRSLWVHLWIIAVASGAVRTALGQIQLRLRSVCGWPYWLFGEHFWGRAEEAVLTFWQLGSWPAESIKWTQALFQMLSDDFRQWTHFSEWLIPLMDKLGMVYGCFTNIIHVQIKQSAALHVAECFRADTQVRLSSSTCIEILTPTNARCALSTIYAVNKCCNSFWNPSINPDFDSFRGVEPHSMGDLQDPIYGGT